MREVDRTHLERRVGISLVYLEVLYGHGAPRVLSITHDRECTPVINQSNAYELLSENIRGGNDPVCFTDLQEKS